MTELLLQGLAVIEPSTRWVLWGSPARLEHYRWPGAEVERSVMDPRVLAGQGHALTIPAGDLVVFMHQQRPLRRRSSITLIHDTIPLRYGRSRPLRELKRVFLRQVVARSQRILTVSEHSRASILKDLGASDELVDIIRIPFDHSFVGRVGLQRPRSNRRNRALYVGGFLPHKNLRGLLIAFGASAFRRTGGELVLVGGNQKAVSRISGNNGPGPSPDVTVRARCSQDELDSLFATSLFLVQPSLEEGFGLPAWEAICCGLPVCSSDGGALPEVVRDHSKPFAARSTEAMTLAIDACAELARSRSVNEMDLLSDAVRRNAPSVPEFARQVSEIVERTLN